MNQVISFDSILTFGFHPKSDKAFLGARPLPLIVSLVLLFGVLRGAEGLKRGWADFKIFLILGGCASLI